MLINIAKKKVKKFCDVVRQLLKSDLCFVPEQFNLMVNDINLALIGTGQIKSVHI